MIKIFLKATCFLAFTAYPAFAPPYIGIDISAVILLRLHDSISLHENCRSWNNPGCLVYARQKNAKKLSNGYALFRTSKDGDIALLKDLQTKLRRGLTVKDIVNTYDATYLDKLIAETGLKKADCIGVVK